jgi:hypothetical protein
MSRNSMQACAHVELDAAGSKGVRHRTVMARELGRMPQLRFAQVVSVDTDLELRAADHPNAVDDAERRPRGDGDLPRGVPGSRECVGKRHREASGVAGCGKFLGARCVGRMGLATRPEQGQLASSAGLEVQTSGPALQVAAPDDECAAFEYFVGHRPFVHN